MNEKSEKGKSISQSKLIPKDAQVIMSIMKDMDILDYEPRVINQLLEFIYRYVTCILDDARVYANHAKKKGIDLEDVKLAIEMTLEKSFTSPPPREILLEIARTKNNTPLPLIKPHAGLRLPPDRFCLSACNYKLKNNSRKIYQTIKVGSNFSMQSGTKMQNKPQNLQTVMKRTGTLPTMAKTQTVNMPKPVFKFSTTAQQKTISKSKIQIATGSQMSNAQQMIKTEIVKMEVDPTNLKRKREDDDYDL